MRRRVTHNGKLKEIFKIQMLSKSLAVTENKRPIPVKTRIKGKLQIVLPLLIYYERDSNLNCYFCLPQLTEFKNPR